MRRAFGLLLLAAMPLAAADKWIRLTGPNFELYTNNSEAAGRETILYFEQLRSFFAQLPEYRQQQLTPVRVVEFSSGEQFRPYKFIDWEAGHYESNGSRDWIALGPAPNAETRKHFLAHEYHHLVASRAGLRLPPWLTEGLADFFCTLKPSDNGTRIGDLVPERLEMLKRGGWLNLDTLISVDSKTFAAFKGEEASLFYAQSWLITHFASLVPEYAPNFPKLVAALNQGRSSKEALQFAFGRTPDAIEKDVREYLARPTKPTRQFPERIDTVANPDIALAPAGDFEVALVMTDLLAVMNKEEPAKAAFDDLNRRFVALEQIQSAEYRAAPLAAMYFHLARVGWNPKQANDRTLDTLEKILDLPQVQRAGVGQAAVTAELYYEFARLEKEVKAPHDKVETALLRVLQLQPGHLDASLKLGELYLEDNKLPAAASAFMQIPVASKAAVYALGGLRGVAAEYVVAGNFAEARRTAEDGRKWIRTLYDATATDRLLVYIAQRAANTYLQAGDLAQARANLDAVKPVTMDAADRSEIERLRGLIDARSKGKLAVRGEEKLLHVEGMAFALDCPKAGPLLRVRVDGKEMLFDLPDPDAVEVSSSGTTAVELRCGALKPFRITVEYAPPGISQPASAGVIRKMAF